MKATQSQIAYVSRKNCNQIQLVKKKKNLTVCSFHKINISQNKYPDELSTYQMWQLFANIDIDITCYIRPLFLLNTFVFFEQFSWESSNLEYQ